MVDIIFRFSPQLRDVLGRFAKAEKALLETRKKELDKLALDLESMAEAEAPKGATGEFAKGITTEIFVQGKVLGFNLLSPQPLGLFIRGGTKPHKIAAKGGGVLAFLWASGPQGPGLHFFKSVNHPGTKPDDYALRAKNRWIPVARESLNRMALSYTAELT